MKDKQMLKNVYTRFSNKLMMEVFKSKAFYCLFTFFITEGYSKNQIVLESRTRNEDYDQVIADFQKNFATFYLN